MTTPSSAAGEPVVDSALAADHGLTGEEFGGLCDLLGRSPTWTELGIASALYSEHCSYKSSKIHLRRFPTRSRRVVHGPGENAGVVDIGHGWVAAFKMESHNHPSFIEPYQGAATGVGGILRDVFTMGARPIACLDSLRFGEIDGERGARMRHLVDGVVRGIGDYGNCVGIPTVGGETGFHPSYNGNILVNAFALGVCREDRIFTAAASGAGNPILYAGSRTGRDGIHGATMASEAFDAESEAKRPTVQVGDPFTEKVLLEASLEAMRSGVVLGVQDMGAAGLDELLLRDGRPRRCGSGARSRPGAAARGLPDSLRDHALRVAGTDGLRHPEGAGGGRHADPVPLGLEASKIGRVTDSGRARLTFRGRTVADMPVEPLVDGAPVYDRPAAPPADLRERQRAVDCEAPEDPLRALKGLLGTPELGDKTWIHRQYDSTVRSNTIVGPGSDAAVLRLKGTPSALALTSDVNPSYCWLEPRMGGRQAVAEAVRNLATVGAEPVGMTNCLNFGSPENPGIAWQLRECIEGMAEACRAFDVPVISGNVSLYNETEGEAVHPTPTVAIVGVIDRLEDVGAEGDLHLVLGCGFWRPGDRVVLLGSDGGEYGGSAYQRLLHGVEAGRPPAVDLEAEAALCALLRQSRRAGWLSGCHDLADGGLLLALAECAMVRGIGLRAAVDCGPLALFSEGQARAIVTVPAGRTEDLLAAAEAGGVAAREIGDVGGDRLVLDFDGGAVDSAVDELRRGLEGSAAASGRLGPNVRHLRYRGRA